MPGTKTQKALSFFDLFKTIHLTGFIAEATGVSKLFSWLKIGWVTGPTSCIILASEFAVQTLISLVQSCQKGNEETAIVKAAKDESGKHALCALGNAAGASGIALFMFKNDVMPKIEMLVPWLLATERGLRFLENGADMLAACRSKDITGKVDGKKLSLTLIHAALAAGTMAGIAWGWGLAIDEKPSVDLFTKSATATLAADAVFGLAENTLPLFFQSHCCKHSGNKATAPASIQGQKTSIDEFADETPSARLLPEATHDTEKKKGKDSDDDDDTFGAYQATASRKV